MYASNYSFAKEYNCVYPLHVEIQLSIQGLTISSEMYRKFESHFGWFSNACDINASSIFDL